MVKLPLTVVRPRDYATYFAVLDDSADYFRSMVLPVKAIIDRVHPSEVILTGISGGATFVPLYAALDDRVVRSYAIDGLLPNDIATGTWAGDFAALPGIRDVASSYTLYLLAGYGAGRRHVHLANLGFTGPIFVRTAVNWRRSPRAEVLALSAHTTKTAAGTLSRTVSSSSFFPMPEGAFVILRPPSDCIAQRTGKIVARERAGGIAKA